MKKFKVTFEDEVRILASVVIEADSEKEAKKIFNNLPEDLDNEDDLVKYRYREKSRKLLKTKIKGIEEC